MGSLEHSCTLLHDMHAFPRTCVLSNLLLLEILPADFLYVEDIVNMFGLLDVLPLNCAAISPFAPRCPPLR
jgi:hypothetical protein